MRQLSLLTPGDQPGRAKIITCFLQDTQSQHLIKLVHMQHTERWHAVAKITNVSSSDDAFSSYVLIGDKSECISVYTTKDVWSNASQTTSASCLSECVMNSSWWSFTLVLGADHL